MFGTGAAGDTFAGIVVLVVGILAVVLLVLGLLMPWFVYQISQRSADLEQHARETNGLLRAILEAVEKIGPPAK